MPDSDLIQIVLNKIIHAPRTRTLRLVTQLQDFPSYMPNVKEVSVLERKHNVLKTRWKVQTDGIPITWVEEDTLSLKGDRISFKAIEGDLSDFFGEWEFSDHPEGTEVILRVFLRVGIPAIKEFAEAYIQKILTRNFEAILESLERRVISIRYSNLKAGTPEKVAGFGIIGHLYNFYHLEKCLKMLRPEFQMPSREFLSQLFHLTPSFKFQDIHDFRSKTGETVNGCLV